LFRRETETRSPRRPLPGMKLLGYRWFNRGVARQGGWGRRLVRRRGDD
jgi:hypothetical protein